ncbi:hypothetical protein AVEN_82163-1 [Araneus ventricosus]|uniref:Uncharacterized protein n=1 Tax=Araneus ventricosus TaxID=182803 RepID=A0A4Y2FYB0_ARAVE|nr:hypothetical protein AVEN_82163-1 [Araneus ventricosus]
MSVRIRPQRVLMHLEKRLCLSLTACKASINLNIEYGKESGTGSETIKYIKYSLQSKIYNVTFFGSQPLRQWVTAANIRKYEKSDPAAFPGKRLRLAIEQGNEAVDTPFTIRIKKYSLATLRAKKCRTTMLNGHAENGSCEASEANDEKGPSTDGQQASPDRISSLDPRANPMQSQPMHQALPSSTGKYQTEFRLVCIENF